MKTAISVPDEIFEAADELAHELGMSRSELYSRAVAQFLARRSDEAVTKKLNEIYGKEASGVDPLLELMQLRSLSDEEW